MNRPPKPKMKVNGREMMRIQGVYMYMINQRGQVGAIMGFFPLVVVMYEDGVDNDPVRGYLRADRWIYPLARSFSPIYIWGPDRMIMPDPFSPLTEPKYMVIRTPFAMSRFQKDALWNLLNVNAHVCGKFADFTVDQLSAMDKLFYLTEITPGDRYILDGAEEGSCPPGTKDLPSLFQPKMKHKLIAFTRDQGKLSVAFNHENRPNYKFGVKMFEKDNFTPEEEKCLPPGLQFNRSERFTSLTSSDSPDMHSHSLSGNQPELIHLPPGRGNIMRLYILGPRDPQHIEISTVMEWMPVTELTFRAVCESFKEQVRLRKEKELHGVPPTFEGRRLRLFGGWGAAEMLNAFGVAKKTATHSSGPYMDVDKVDPAYNTMFQSALWLQNLEAAAGLFDFAIDNCKLELLSYSSTLSDADRSSPTRWLGALIPRPLVVRYRKLVPIFSHLMTLSATVQNDLFYVKRTNYLDRIHEDCEHHYPKWRPRNWLLDPQYPYPREPSPCLTK